MALEYTDMRDVPLISLLLWLYRRLGVAAVALVPVCAPSSVRHVIPIIIVAVCVSDHVIGLLVGLQL